MPRSASPPKKSWLKRLVDWVTGRKPTYRELYDGRAFIDCERCGRTHRIELADDGEVLNFRMVGWMYTCKECAEIIYAWDEGERVWVKHPEDR